MLAKKEVLLLEALNKSRNQYLSSLNLSKSIGVTDRTTRKYLKNLIKIITNYGAEITSKQGYGYCLTVHDEQVFEDFWRSTLKSKKELTDISQVEETEDRQRYILNKLLLENQFLDFDGLLKELFVSKTTLSTDLNRIKETLQPYGLTLAHQKKQLSIVGAEQDIRHFLIDYFTDDAFEESILATVSPSFVGDVDFPQLMMIVLEECRKGSLNLSDFVIHNLVLHIALMIQRIRLGYPLELFDLEDSIQTSKEYQVALNILSRVETSLQIQFPIEEANYIALHLKVKHTNPKDSLLGEENEDDLRHHLKNVLDDIGQTLQMKLSEDRILCNGLEAHFSPLLIRLKNQIQLSNPLLTDIKKNYLSYLEMTKLHFQQLPELQGYRINDDEWAYIALHLIAAIERYNTNHKRRVLVVCATGYGSAMMLKSRLENEFGSSLIISDVVSYYDICEEKLKDIDLIISSLTLPSHLFLRPVINVSVFLTTDEVTKIRAFLGDQGNTYNPTKRKDTSPNSQEAITLFRKDQFIVVKEAISKEELLKLMVSKLDEADQVAFTSQFIQQMELRESYSPIIYEDCLAFPHPVQPMSQKEQIVVAICPNSIVWDKNHQEVTFVFLLSPSTLANKRLKQVSSSLVDFVASKELQQKLINQPTHHQLVTIFKTLLD